MRILLTLDDIMLIILNITWLTKRINIMRKNLNAFTLAETLITLAIIGVVAALTIPTLVNNVLDSQYKNSFKEIFSQLNQAYKFMLADNNNDLSTVCNSSPGGMSIADANCFNTTLAKYLKVIQTCDANGSWLNDCLYSTPNIRYLNNDDSGCGFANPGVCYWSGPGFTMANGAQISVGEWDPAYCNSTSPTDLGCIIPGQYGLMFVDINGAKPPNIMGKDLFVILPSNKTTISGFNDTSGNNSCDATNCWIFQTANLILKTIRTRVSGGRSVGDCTICIYYSSAMCRLS